MTGFRTRGQPAATRQAMAMLAAGLPHALLLVGPRSVGKTTLAMDIVAAQLCQAADVAARPCRACRSCRLVDDGNHPDVHRLAPEGAGDQIKVEPVRQLIGDLALLAAEGGARIAVFEQADRLNEDAQNILLKTLEEPPVGVTLILCADDEDRLLPTIHSRVARLRLGTMPPREIEQLLAERGEADEPTANRLARLAEGRAGLAVAYANVPDAATIRGEIARSLLDLADAPRALRLARVRELLARAKDLRTALRAFQAPEPLEQTVRARGGRGRAGRGAASASSAALVAPVAERAPEDSGSGEAAIAGEGSESPPMAGPAGKSSALERRRDAGLLLDIWRDVARDLVLVGLGERGPVHDPALLEELGVLAFRIPADALGAFLVRLDSAGSALEVNVSPELIADVLALAWPRPARAA